jgi:hypothetical protein
VLVPLVLLMLPLLVMLLALLLLFVLLVLRILLMQLLLVLLLVQVLPQEIKLPDLFNSFAVTSSTCTLALLALLAQPTVHIARTTAGVVAPCMAAAVAAALLAASFFFSRRYGHKAALFRLLFGQQLACCMTPPS